MQDISPRLWFRLKQGTTELKILYNIKDSENITSFILFRILSELTKLIITWSDYRTTQPQWNSNGTIITIPWFETGAPHLNPRFLPWSLVICVSKLVELMDVGLLKRVIRHQISFVISTRREIVKTPKRVWSLSSMSSELRLVKSRSIVRHAKNIQFKKKRSLIL